MQCSTFPPDDVQVIPENADMKAFEMLSEIEAKEALITNMQTLLMTRDGESQHFEHAVSSLGLTIKTAQDALKEKREAFEKFLRSTHYSNFMNLDMRDRALNAQAV